jgi:hypothetical protein
MQPKRGELLVNEDVLSCGPLPPFQALEQWTRFREAYWDSVAPSDAERSLNLDIRTNIGALREADSIFLWLGLGAAEQLFLAWMVKLLEIIGSRAQVHVVQFTRIGERNVNAWGLGLLHPEHIKKHPPAERLSEEAISEFERVWDIVTSTDPAGLLSFLSEQSAFSRHCRDSLQLMVHRYPNYETGLSRWDSELLRYVKENGPKVVRVIGEALGRNFDADLVGDAYLFSRLRKLAGSDLAHPLVSISGNPTRMRECDVVLTDAGQSVLAGRANAVQLNGIDDWVLGVHLDCRRGSVWYQKDGNLVAG